MHIYLFYYSIFILFKKTLYNSPLKRPMYHHPSLHWSLARHGVTQIGVTSSNNETSPAIVTHNRSDKKSVVCADPVREKIGPSLRLFLGAPYDKKSIRVHYLYQTDKLVLSFTFILI